MVLSGYFFNSKFMNKIAKIKKIEAIDPTSKFGDTKEWHHGLMEKAPTVGERFVLFPYSDENGHFHEGINTSPVVEYDEKTNIITTMYSKYLLVKDIK